MEFNNKGEAIVSLYDSDQRVRLTHARSWNIQISGCVCYNSLAIYEALEF